VLIIPVFLLSENHAFSTILALIWFGLVWFGFLPPQSAANFVVAGDGCRFWRTHTHTQSLHAAACL
jgi:hypothetical protein